MRKRKNKIGIIGHFGGGNLFFDGQTVKTKVLYNEMTAIANSDSASQLKIHCVDTYYNNTNKLKLFLASLRCIFTCQTIIMLLSHNGMRIYFPMMYWAKKLLHRKVYHDVIGGNLAEYVRKYPKYQKYLNSFDGNWVEFEKMKQDLEAEGIGNCTVIPNFKHLNMEDAAEVLSEDAKFRFCMFSRVMKEKGISDAIEAIVRYNHTHACGAVLEIWGPVDNSYQEEFNRLLEEHPADVIYKGVADYSESVKNLTNHIALLFPTYWSGEGFPGTIVDAYTAGVPVIASDWNANSELVSNFVTGWVYPNPETETLYDSIVWAVEHPDKMDEMRRNCLAKAGEYSADVQMKKIRAIVGI